MSPFDAQSQPLRRRRDAHDGSTRGSHSGHASPQPGEATHHAYCMYFFERLSALVRGAPPRRTPAAALSLRHRHHQTRWLAGWYASYVDCYHKELLRLPYSLARSRANGMKTRGWTEVDGRSTLQSGQRRQVQAWGAAAVQEATGGDAGDDGQVWHPQVRAHLSAVTLRRTREWGRRRHGSRWRRRRRGARS